MQELDSSELVRCYNTTTREFDVIRLALDESLDKKWETFSSEFRTLWSQFQTECIESSHKLVVAEKRVADERYSTLDDAFSRVKQKCADYERYNQLLQEKLDNIQEEMKSLSSVSMTIQWEKRVADKENECMRLKEQLDKQKRINTTLKRENTLLNTQLERMEDSNKIASCDFADASASASKNAMDAAFFVSEKVDKLSAIMTQEGQSNVDSTTQQSSKNSEVQADSYEKHDNADIPQTVLSSSVSENREYEPELQQLNIQSVSSLNDSPKSITYTLKKLKRRKNDTEKTKFLLGTNNLLYQWTDGDIPGQVVGNKTTKGYKFLKK